MTSGAAESAADFEVELAAESAESRGGPPCPAARATARCTADSSMRSAGSGFGGRFLELAIAHQARMASRQQVLGLDALELAQRVVERALEQPGHLDGIAVGAAHRLGNDAVDHAQRLEAVGRERQRLGRLGRLL